MDAFVSYDGIQNEEEKECGGPGASRDAQQEIDAGAEEGDSAEGRSRAVGFIYFIETQDGQYIKIGFSRKAVRRLGQLGTIMPVRLLGYFPGSISTERWLQSKFANQWNKGEWFKSSEELRGFIAVMDLIQPKEEDAIRPNSPTGAKNPAAVALGRRGGKKKVPKGLAMLTPERRREIASQGGKASKRGPA